MTLQVRGAAGPNQLPPHFVRKSWPKQRPIRVFDRPCRSAL